MQEAQLMLSYEPGKELSFKIFCNKVAVKYGE